MVNGNENIKDPNIKQILNQSFYSLGSFFLEEKKTILMNTNSPQKPVKFRNKGSNRTGFVQKKKRVLLDCFPTKYDPRALVHKDQFFIV